VHEWRLAINIEASGGCTTVQEKLDEFYKDTESSDSGDIEALTNTGNRGDVT